MDLAICICVKNQSNRIVEQEDPIETYKDIANKIQLSPTDSHFPPTLNRDGTITLNLLPKMLTSLVSVKRPSDTWTIIIVDYESTDFNVEMICKGILNGIPFVVHTERSTFDRETGLNIAATIARDRGHQVLFFCDSDMYFTKPYIFDRAIECIEKDKLYSPICFTFTLPSHERGYWCDTQSSLLFIKTETYFNSSRVSELTPERSLAIGGFHQWHPRSDI